MCKQFSGWEENCQASLSLMGWYRVVDSIICKGEGRYAGCSYAVLTEFFQID